MSTTRGRTWAVVAGIAIWTNAVAEWEVSKRTDPFTDKTVTTATVTGSVLNAELGMTGQPILVARCEDDRFDMFVAMDQFLGDEVIDVRYRIDNAPTVKARWFGSTSDTAAFIREERSIARELMDAKTFLVEVKDYRGNRHGGRFDIEGGRQALTEVVSECGIATEGLTEKIEGLKPDLARWLERWGPQNTYGVHEMLIAGGWIAGPPTTAMTPALAQAVQAYYDDFVERCTNNQLRKGEGSLCFGVKAKAMDDRLPGAMPPSVIIQAGAPRPLREKYGKLRIGD